MKPVLLTIAAAMVAALAIVRAGPGQAQDLEAGRRLAEENCARCHAVGENGESPFEEAPPFREFPARWPLENLEEALAEGIVVGHEAMPEFVLAPQQIADLLAYIESLAR